MKKKQTGIAESTGELRACNGLTGTTIALYIAGEVLE